ncbi:MAG: M48 family metallopeptidase [Rhodospirillales bacterium]
MWWTGRPKPARARPKKEAPLELAIAGRALSVAVKRNRQAKRLILRMDPATGGARLTLPFGVGRAEAEAFLRARADWIGDRLAPDFGPVPFEAGAVIPFRGEPHRIERVAKGPPVTPQDGLLLVAGQAEHLSRRLQDWLKREARKAISPLVQEKAARAQLTPGRISLRDTRSRWGSCAQTGALSFSWRLILAPPSVLDYVVAHEVAHLRHHNHGPAFHALNMALADDATFARNWLKEQGTDLHRYGKPRVE